MQTNPLAQSPEFNGGALLGSLVIALVFAVLIYIGWRHKRKEIGAFRAWADRYGYRYARRDDSVVELSSAAPFGAGRDPKGYDVFRGTYRGTGIVFFQYHFTAGSGEDAAPVDYQVVAIGLPGAAPLLDVGHENPLSKRFGDDIDFENQRFNDLFKITSPNRRFAFDVIHARTMEWMLADRRARTYRWRFDGPWLMSLSHGGVDLGDVFARADFLIDIRAQVPGHVWATQ